MTFAPTSADTASTGADRAGYPCLQHTTHNTQHAVKLGQIGQDLLACNTRQIDDILRIKGIVDVFYVFVHSLDRLSPLDDILQLRFFLST